MLGFCEEGEVCCWLLGDEVLGLVLWLVGWLVLWAAMRPQVTNSNDSTNNLDFISGLLEDYVATNWKWRYLRLQFPESRVPPRAFIHLL